MFECISSRAFLLINCYSSSINIGHVIDCNDKQQELLHFFFFTVSKHSFNILYYMALQFNNTMSKVNGDICHTGN